jgi:hypothetical protein
MKITYCFDRAKPFANAYPDEPPTALLACYEAALADAMRARFPADEISVESLVEGKGDVEFDPHDAVPED